MAVKAIDPGVALQSGDRIYLLKTAGLTGNASLVNSANVSQGFSLQYDLAMVQDANDIYATVSGSSVNPKTKSFLEGRLAGLALVTQGADIVAGQGMSSAIAAAEQQEGRLTVFGTVSGGTSRYDTGSHIDLDGFGLMAGVSQKQDNLAGAVFVEGGWGSYDSHNNFANGSVKGDGDTHYYGVGLLGRATLKMACIWTDRSGLAKPARTILARIIWTSRAIRRITRARSRTSVPMPVSVT